MPIEAWKILVRAHMESFLKAYGWPWPGATQFETNTEIMRLLREMFLTLDRANLIPNGYTYQDFYKVAYDRYMNA